MGTAVGIAAVGEEGGVRPAHLAPVVVGIADVDVLNLLPGQTGDGVLLVGEEHHGVVGDGDELQLHAGGPGLRLQGLGGLGGGKEHVRLAADEPLVGLIALAVAGDVPRVIAAVLEEGAEEGAGVGVGGGGAVHHRDGPVKAVVDGGGGGVDGQEADEAVQQLHGLQPGGGPEGFGQGCIQVGVLRLHLGGDAQASAVSRQTLIGGQGPAGDGAGILQLQLRLRVRLGRQAQRVKSPPGHDHHLRPGDGAGRVEVDVGGGQAEGAGGCGGGVVPVIRRHVGIARIPAALRAQNPQQQGKGLCPGDGAVREQLPPLVPLEHPPGGEVLGAQRRLVVLRAVPGFHLVGKGRGLGYPGGQRFVCPAGRENGVHPAVVVVRERDDLPGVGVGGKEVAALGPGQVLALRILQTDCDKLSVLTGGGPGGGDGVGRCGGQSQNQAQAEEQREQAGRGAFHTNTSFKYS